MRGGLRIWRALERAREINLAEAGEQPPVPGDDSITRRRMLALLAGATGAAMLPRSPAYARPARRVAIVGGGLAGLTALDRLRANGVDATLYEARGAVGGRTRSVRGVFARDFAFDEGAQLVNTDHRDVIGLLDRFGLRRVERARFGTPHEIQIGRDGAAVSEEAIAEALRGVARQIDRDYRRIDGNEAAVREIDAMSVADYLTRAGLPAGDARDALEAGVRTEYGSEPRDATALELLWNLPVVDGHHVTRISLSDEVWVVDGGTGQIAQRLAAPLRRHIRLGKRLTHVDSGPNGVRLRFADGERITAHRAIVALPASLLREIRFTGDLPEQWRAFIAEADLGRNEKVIVGYDRQSWRERLGFAGALWGAGDFSAVWDAASMTPSPNSQPGALTYFLGGAQVEAARGAGARALAARFSSAARRVLPNLPAPNGRVRRTRWCEDPLTKGAYMNFRPGQYSRFASLLTMEEEGRTPRPSQAGSLLFAGEFLSDAWPGYMNGAVQTGRVAADAAMERLALAA
ncbi:flavin monoamine oxidase family protein [Allosphingosinicella sp.]|jgi:monoamine oxidase|uniref:flavin monoamine oxidase family protein n=1 Tax=Allosphingosinicella sp. TaxID=2823234 RepID=UPI002F1E9DEB